MRPANNRFRADQPAVRETDLRLIKQFESVAFGSQRQFSLKHQPCLQLLPDRVLEDHMTATPGCLGATESEMAVAQEFVRRPAILRMDSRADADPHAVLSRSRQQRRVERICD